MPRAQQRDVTERNPRPTSPGRWDPPGRGLSQPCGTVQTRKRSPDDRYASIVA